MVAEARRVKTARATVAEMDACIRAGPRTRRGIPVRATGISNGTTMEDPTTSSRVEAVTWSGPSFEIVAVL
jgi:hypothetical protein